MHYFTFSSQDTFISSGSNRITGISEKDRNFGQDQILEVKKERKQKMTTKEFLKGNKIKIGQNLN